jgi:kinase-associated protein B
MELLIGDYVTFPYKTGKYIGEVLEVNSDKSLVKVHAVLKHPLQGDLHAPKQAEATFFHERKALAYQEKVRLFHSLIHKYDEDIPVYKKSLLDAFDSYKRELQQLDDERSRMSIHCLDNLSKEYMKLS